MIDSSAKPAGHIPIRLITLNVRYAAKRLAPGEEPWAIRCPKLCAQLNFITSGHTTVFVCLQEVLPSQLLDIQARLGPSWSHIGHGRENGQNAGEHCPVFFRTVHWECERSRTYWLSPTPEVPSRGWDAALNRIVTMGSFRHRATGTAVVIMSTHLDYAGEMAREQGAHLLLKLARDWTDGGDGAPTVPLFLGGDFNSTSNSRAYRTITMPGSGMRDVSELVPEDMKYGNRAITYTSFGEPGEKPNKIDYLFVQESRGVSFLTYGILSNRFDDGVYLSDHRAVVADMEIPAKADN
ncbi:Endonuclease/exonuclease/phosphatase [Lasiosphaeria hispida]|uniref:Endonuclease/exonuclease/phosphatase n=1 Tax=Lasiosphaeria hispida TaxID=260671 RepID=A0AAJ0MI28_9PEZI|nr:Endonuclease/exonuclease/phosphatase [Lasiosphaeria hispida]